MRLLIRKLSRTDRVQILRCLVDGTSIRATCRITGFSIPTVLKLLVDIGTVASDYCDRELVNLTCERIECDEIWSFVGAKQKSVKKGAKAHGDIWTWTAIDAKTKLIPCWMLGTRDADSADVFIKDLASRLTHRVQLTTDGHHPYLNAVAEAFGADIDYAMLVKIYGAPPPGERQAHRRYSPDEISKIKKEVITGAPAEGLISTSYVERQNLTMRMNMRRFTRLTNAFSKKVENHGHAVALHFWFYNFARIHKTLRVTPAMAAGVTDRVLDLEDLVIALEATEDDAKTVATRRKDRRG